MQDATQFLIGFIVNVLCWAMEET